MPKLLRFNENASLSASWTENLDHSNFYCALIWKQISKISVQWVREVSCTFAGKNRYPSGLSHAGALLCVYTGRLPTFKLATEMEPLQVTTRDLEDWWYNYEKDIYCVVGWVYLVNSRQETEHCLRVWGLGLAVIMNFVSSRWAWSKSQQPTIEIRSKAFYITFLFLSANLGPQIPMRLCTYCTLQ